MTRFHINTAGDASECKAQMGQCPFGNDREHYHTKEDARVAFELTMQKKLPKDWEKLSKSQAALSDKSRNYTNAEKDWNKAFSRKQYWKSQVPFTQMLKGLVGKSEAKQEIFAQYEEARQKIIDAKTELNQVQQEIVELKKRAVKVIRIRKSMFVTWDKIPMHMRTPPPAPVVYRQSSSDSYSYRNDHRYTHTGHYDSRSSHSSF